MKAPKIKDTILTALENGAVLDAGKANQITCSTEGARTLRLLVQRGYPIVTRMRPNKLRPSRPIKEFYYTPATIAEIKAAKAEKEAVLFQ